MLTVKIAVSKTEKDTASKKKAMVVSKPRYCDKKVGEFSESYDLFYTSMNMCILRAKQRKEKNNVR